MKIVIATFTLFFAIATAAVVVPSASRQISSFDQAVVDRHNFYRAEVGTPPAQWDTTLASDASAYAGVLANIDRLEHDQNRNGQGENILFTSVTDSSPEALVNQWVTNEKPLFKNGIFPDISTNGDWTQVGHYSQIIWSTSTSIGCGSAVSSSDRLYFVCRYLAHGNVRGQRAF